MKYEILFSVSVLLAAASGCGESQQKVPSNLQIVNANLAGQCIHNRIKVSDSGHAALWMSQDSDPLSAVNKSPSFLTLALNSNNNYSLFKVPGPLPITPLFWSKDGLTLYVRLGDLEIGAIHAGNIKFKHLFFLEKDWKDVEIVTNSLMDIDSLRSKKSIDYLIASRKGKDAVREWVLFENGELQYFYVDRQSLLIKNYDNSDEGLYAHSARNFRPGNFQGAVNFGQHDSNLTRPGDGVIARYALNHTTGDLVGRYTYDEFYPDKFNKNKVSVTFSNNSKDDLFIDSMSFSNNYGSKISYNNRGISEIIINTLDGKLLYKAPLCQDSALSKKNIEKFDYEIVSQNISLNYNSDYYNLPNYLFQASTNYYQPRNLIIYFHGGPASSFFDNKFPDIFRNLFSKDLDIMVVDYLGSAEGALGGEIFRRDPMAALNLSSRAISNWVNLNHKRYSTISIVGESFGAIPAKLLQNQEVSHVGQYVYIAPLVKLKNPSDWITNNDHIDPLTQERFENSVFGGSGNRNRFSRDLFDVWSRESATSRSLFIFAERDRKSSQSDIREFQYKESQSQVEIIKGLDHDTITASDKVWKMVEDRIK